MELGLSVSGREIKYHTTHIEIGKICFSTSNPRIASILTSHTGKITDDVIDKILWGRNDTHKLFKEIEKDGGLQHPILVYKGEVLEGNTRLCCYRHLLELTNDERWKSIKCNVIQDQLSQNDIYRLLCTEHIEGKIAWDAYEKANLYYRMKNIDLMSPKEISGLVGEGVKKVKDRIEAFTEMKKSKVKDTLKYSHFEQLVGNGAIKEIAKKKDPQIVSKVVELIEIGSIPKAQDIRKIGSIYKHKSLRRRLLVDKENVQQVYHDLKAKNPMVDTAIMKKVKELTTSVKKLKRHERQKLKSNKSNCKGFESLIKELLKLSRELEIKIHVPKKDRR